MNLIKQISQIFKHELQGDTTTWALGNVGDKKIITTTISVQAYAVSDTDNPFILQNIDGMIGAGWIQDPQGNLGIFKIGDTVRWFEQSTSTTGTMTVLDVQDNNNIQLSGTFPSPWNANNCPMATMVLSLATPITSIKYHYNWLENNNAPSFVSPVDGSEQLWVIQYKLASDTSVSAMKAMGATMWQNGSATIAGVAIDPGTTDGVYKSEFVIVHTVNIPSEILQPQLNNQLAGINPPDFATINNCWGFIYQIDAYELYTDPNFITSQVFNTSLGNTGWFGENFSTGITKYTTSIVYKDAGGNVIPSIELITAETTCTITVNDPTASFSNNNTQFILGIEKVPYDPSEYQTSGFKDDNFLFDRALQTVGSAAVNGNQYGVANRQILKNVVGTYVNTSVITITCGIDMLSGVLAVFNKSVTPRYLLKLIIQNYTLATDVSDLVTLQVDINEFAIVTTDPGMIVIDKTVFIRHPEVNPATEGIQVGFADPTPVVWNIIYISGSPKFGIIDQTAGKWYGTFDFTTDLNTSMAGLVNSVNTNTSGGTIPLLGKPFDNSAGFKASWDIPTQNFTLSAPVGSATTYNGYVEQFAVYGGAMGGAAGTYQTFTGGSVTTLDVYPQDELVAMSNFYIESSGRTITDILLTQVNAKIIASNGTKSFELDQFIMPLSSVPLTGNTQQFDIQQQRPFNVPVGSIRKYIEVKRRSDLDTGTRYYFSSNYAFMVRWEDWVAALQVDPSFFNNSLPNNGLNEKWFQFQSGGWSLYYELVVQATESGTAQSYNVQIPFTIHDYNSDSAYTEVDSMAFNPSDLAALQSGAGGARQLVTGASTSVTINGQVYKTNGQGLVNLSGKTLMACIFTKSTAPASVNVEMQIEVYKNGGIVGVRCLSSKWVTDGNTWFTSIDGSGKVVLAAFGNSIVALAYVDSSDPNFPTSATSFSVSGRIYEIGGILETDDSIPLQTDDGIDIEQD